MNAHNPQRERQSSAKAATPDSEIEKVAARFGYQFSSQQYSPTYDSLIRTFHHTDSGATVFSIANSDPFLSLSLSFRTPPTDSSGIFHLIEHLVLCGSEKYPNRDTFRDMKARSYGTAPNAYTAKFHTHYPVSSFNERDFLMQADVYFAAVFKALLREEDFLNQRGHFRSKEDGSVAFDGVVYREMREQVFKPFDRIFRAGLENYWRGTPGVHYSGGDPEELRLITFDRVRETYQKHYHPANCAITFYGNFPLERQFELAAPYLENAGQPGRLTHTVEGAIGTLERGGGIVECRLPVADSADLETRLFSTSYRLSDDKSRQHPEYLSAIASLIGAPDSIANQRVRELGISPSILSAYSMSMFDPFISLQLEKVAPDKIDPLRDALREQFSALAAGQINPNQLAAIFTGIAGDARIHAGQASRGHDRHLNREGVVTEVMEGWVYGKDPLIRLEVGARSLEHLGNPERAISEISEIVRQGLLLNGDCSTVIGRTDVRLLEEFEKREAAWVAATYPLVGLKEDLFAGRPEDGIIPGLQVSDLSREQKTAWVSSHPKAKDEIIFARAALGDISRLELAIDFNRIPPEHLNAVYLAVSLGTFFGSTRTPFGEFRDRKGMLCDTAVAEVYAGAGPGEGQLITGYSLRAQSRLQNVADYLNLIIEGLQQTDFSNPELARSILGNYRKGLEMKPITNPDGSVISWMINYALSDLHPAFRVNSALSGFDYLREFQKLEQLAQSDWGAFTELMTSSSKMALERSAVQPTVVASNETFDLVADRIKEALRSFPQYESLGASVDHYSSPAKGSGRHIAYYSDAVGASQSLAAYGMPLDGPMNLGLGSIIGKLVSDQFLWDQIRNNSQAYGAEYFYSQHAQTFIGLTMRDSDPLRSLEVFGRVGEYLSSGKITKDQLEAAQISLIGGMDRPLGELIWGVAAINNHRFGLSPEYYQNIRDQVLSASLEQIVEVGERLSVVPRAATFLHGPKAVIAPSRLETIN